MPKALDKPRSAPNASRGWELLREVVLGVDNVIECEKPTGSNLLASLTTIESQENSTMATDYSIAKCPPLLEIDGVEVRHVLEFTGYAVGNDGSTWSCRKSGPMGGVRAWRKMKGRPAGSQGYLEVTLRRNGQWFYEYIHRLVLKAFVGKPPFGHETRHLDGNALNNRLGNLRWGTKAENERDRVKHGTTATGERNPAAKLTAKQVLAIRARGPQQDKDKTAREFGISPIYVGQLVSRKRWRHLP